MLRIPLGDISKSGWLADLLHLGVQESLAKRPGSQSLLAKLSELAFIEALRRYAQSKPPGLKGWLAGLQDPHVGPRYLLMESITASGATKEGKKIEAGGLELTERATIDVGLLDLLHRPYREQTINRDTVYRFKAGLPVQMLEASDGSRYAMQAYSQIVDKTLTYDQLDALGSRLKLPSGWRYATTTPDQDLVLGAQGKATVIQDEFDNPYQKLD